jgi:CBS domain-containing protein
MQVKDVMTADPACCTAETPLTELAALMVENDCGGIPIVESEAGKRPVGVVTDRDIVVRLIAKNINPLEKTAAACMTKPIVTVTPETPVAECSRLMEEKQIRRVAVVDDKGEICGIVSLADIARHSGENAAGELVKEVSEPTKSASAAG